MDTMIVADHKQTEPANKTAGERLKICNSCPLFLPNEMVCNPGLWFNPSTWETSKRAKAGFIKGCGCLISRKVKQKSSHCHAGLW